MLDVVVELLALLPELLLAGLGLILEALQVVFGLVAGTVGVACELDGLLDILLLALELLLQLGVDVLHGVLLLPQLVYPFPQLVVVG